MRNTLGMILAGGRGTRLHPLTEHRAKPAVPFGASYRIIDFTLSNCINSNLRKIIVLTQYKSHSLTRHLDSAWNMLSRDLGEFIEVLPPQKRVHEDWYQGTADAIYQNLFRIDDQEPENVLVLSGDHIYKMNYEAMVDEHREKEAALTIAVHDVPVEEATAFGVMEVNDDFEVKGFEEKPTNPRTLPDNEDRSLVSMGVYCFDADVLRSVLKTDARDPDSDHDFGKDIIPRLVEGGHRVQAHLFEDANRGEERYWQDVGTIRSYYEANMDLVSVDPVFNLYDRKWPVRTYHGQHPPAKFVFDDEGRRGHAIDSIVSNGAILSGSRVKRSVVSPGVTVNDGTIVRRSIIMDGARVGKNCELENVILDKNARVEDGVKLGFDLDADSKRAYVSDDGITVVRRDQTVES